MTLKEKVNTLENEITKLREELIELRRSPAEIIRAKHLVIQDEQGRPVIKMSALTEERQADRLSHYQEGASLIFLDEQGNRRMELSMESDEPRLSMFGRNGTMRGAELMISGDDPVLFMYNQEENLRLMVGVIENAPALITYNNEGRTAWKATEKTKEVSS